MSSEKSMTLKSLALGFFVATALIVPGLTHAGTTIVRERFSDEIVGRGLDLIFIPRLASSRDTGKATAERLKASAGFEAAAAGLPAS
jgi:hypothetical protein